MYRLTVDYVGWTVAATEITPRASVMETLAARCSLSRPFVVFSRSRGTDAEAEPWQIFLRHSAQLRVCGFRFRRVER